MIHVADQNHHCRSGDSFEELVGQRHIDHRTFVGNQHIAFEGIVRVAFELAIERIDFQQAMDGLRFQPSRFAKPLGRPAGWRAEQRLDAFDAHDRQNGIDQGGLAHSGSAGDHQQLRRQGKANCLLLAVGQLDGELLLDPGNRLVGSEVRQSRGSRREAADLGGNRLLGVVQGSQKDARLTLDGVRHQHLVGDFLSDRRFDDGFRNVEQFHCQGNQFGIRQTAVTLSRSFGERIRDPGLRAQRRILGDTDLLGDRVG